MAMTPAQLKRIDARCDRQKYKDSDGEAGELGLSIRIGTSTLYDFKPTMKSLLLMIAFMSVKGEGIRMKPRDKSRERIDYNGWCWASEKYLAMRCGISERTVRRLIDKLKKDTVIEVRTWRDSWGRPHNEYRIIEAEVDAAQREFDQPRAKCEWRVRKANSGTFSKTHQPKRGKALATSNDLTTSEKATGQVGREPQVSLAVGHRSGRPLPTGQVGRKPTGKMTAEVGVGVGVDVEGEFAGGSSTYPASQGSPSLASLSKPKLQPQTQKQPQSVTQPVAPPKVPLTPEETCPTCGGYFLDCKHPLVSNAVAQAVAASPSSAHPLLKERQAFEIEDLG
jgi:hypothetical protein